jgi:peptidase M1-like protein
MTSRSAASFSLLALATIAACSGKSVQTSAQPASGGAPAQSVSTTLPERAVRRDIPITNAIRRAYAAGTRDSTGKPGRNYWQLWTEYAINARLDPPSHMLSGRETIVLRNASDSALSSIQMRLDQNILRATVQRGASIPSETTDGFTITKLTVNGQPVDVNPPAFGGRGRGGAAPTQTFLSGGTTTTARINLTSPIAAKASATLDIEWTFKLASGTTGAGHRMTAAWGDSVFQVTQWYPRVAVYDDLRGWDTDPYLGPSEFYNNFGRFDVRLDVPAGWIVGATGVLQNPNEVLTPTARQRLSHVLESDSTRVIVGPNEFGPGNATAAGSRLVWHFVADTVNDFAWGASDRFVWEATRATIPGKGPMPVYMLHPPSRAQAFSGGGAILRHALEFYSRIWMPDAFPVHTMIDGPDQGMEYPMVVMSSNGAADHESGHQWWPMMVSNNETWYGWMDEGFNQYMNILSGADASHQPPNLDGYGQSYARTSGDEREPIMMWDANYGGPLYSFQTYSKTPLMLSMLGGIVGDSAVWRAQSEYAHTWRFKHPSPWDYMFSMSRSLTRDLGWFWYYWLFTTESVDASIQNVTTAGTKTTVTVRQDGQMPSPVVLKVHFAGDGRPLKPVPNADVLDDLNAIVTWPVDVWFAGSRTFTATVDFGRVIDKVTLDPHCRFPDHDVTDNVWPRQPAAASPAGGRGGGGFGGPRCG